MRKLWNLVLAMGRPFIVMVVAAAAIVALMGYRLASLTPGLSDPEIAAVASSSSLAGILENPVNAPYKIALYAVTQVTMQTFAIRLVGALIGALMILLFYLIARKLLSPAVAAATTLLFATSSLLLHSARLATPDILVLFLLALVGVGYLLRFDKHIMPVWLLACVVIGASLYVPGLSIFIILGALWQFRRVRYSFDQLPPLAVAACALLLSILLLPLVVSLIRDTNMWRAYLGLPQDFAPALEMLRSIGKVIASLFVFSPKDPVYWLGKQPVLDIFSSVMFLYGIIALARQYKLDRLWVLFGILFIAVIWLGISANFHAILILLPFICLIIGTGIELLISQWFEVFPRNPIARWIGISLLLIVIGASANFQLRRYFIAWPNNDQTKAVFNKSLNGS